MKKRFRKQFDKLASRFNHDLDRIHSSLLYKFRTTEVKISVGGNCGGRGGVSWVMYGGGGGGGRWVSNGGQYTIPVEW